MEKPFQRGDAVKPAEAAAAAELQGAFRDEPHSTLLTKATQTHTHTHSVQLAHSSRRESSSSRGCFARRKAPAGPQTVSSPAGEINRRDVAPPSRKLFLHFTKGNEEEDHHLSLII